jgi:hypothetical protein
MKTNQTKDKKATNATDTMIELRPITIKSILLTVIGDTELIVNKWSEKAKRQMLDKQMKKAAQPKEAKDPESDYKNSIYTFEDGRYAFPSIAFKAAAVRAAKTDGIAMTDARAWFHIDDELVEIKGEPRMREDTVRLQGGPADIRFRAGFPKWQATLIVRYNSRAISAEQIVNLFNTAGFGTGVGEWRPEKNGNFGRFHVMIGE